MVNTQRILVCESEPLLSELLLFRLKAAGYEVEAAKDGREALVLLRQSLPHALILGDYLPLVNGLELLRVLREDDPREEARDLPIIVLSGRSDAESTMRALRLGASDYISKPLSAQELLVRLERLLRQGQVQKWAKSLQRKIRTPVSIPAQLWLADDREVACLVRDISENGFMAQLEVELEQGSWFGLSLPGHGVLRAQVRWCGNGQLGGLFERPLEVLDPFYSRAA